MVYYVTYNLFGNEDKWKKYSKYEMKKDYYGLLYVDSRKSRYGYFETLGTFIYFLNKILKNIHISCSISSDLFFSQ